VTAELGGVVGGDVFKVLEAEAFGEGGVGGGVFVCGEVGGGEFDGEGEAAELLDDALGGGAVGIGGEGAVFFEEGEGVFGGEFAYGEPVAAGGGGGGEAGGGKDVEFGAEGGEVVGLGGGEEASVANVVEDEKDVAELVEALAEAAGEGGEVGVREFAFFVADVFGEEGGEVGLGEEGFTEGGFAFAGDAEAAAGVGGGEGVGIGESEFGFADAAEALDAGDDAGVVVGAEARAEGE
jgi:hypothetical protein